LASKEEKRERERVDRALKVLAAASMFPFGGKFGSRKLDPVAPEIAELADRANIIASQLLTKVADISTTFAEEAVKLHDQATDLIGKVGKVAGFDFVDDLQELIDFPINRVAQGIAIVAGEIKTANEAVIKSARRRLKR